MPFGGKNIIAIAMAARRGKSDEVCQLILQHAENDPLLKGNSPLFIACAEGILRIVQFLVETAKMDINQKNKEGITPFMVAVTKGNTDVVKYLQKMQEEQELLRKHDTLTSSINKTTLEMNAIKNSIAKKKRDIKELTKERDEKKIECIEDLTQEMFKHLEMTL